MDHRLGVDDDVDLFGREVEEPAGFDQLQALVEHGGGVDGDLVAHPPGGVVEGVGGGGGFDFVEGGVAEGAAGGGEDEALHFGRSASLHGLEDGGVFGVDGEDGDVVFSGEGDEEGAGDDEGFLVGQGDGFASFDGGEDGGEAGGPDYGGE